MSEPGFFGGIIVVLLFFFFIWSGMIGAGIFLIVSSLRKKKKRGAIGGAIYLSIAIGLPALYLGIAIGHAHNCTATCAANGISEKDIISCAFLAIGSIGLLLTFLSTLHFRRKYSTEVEATCIDEKGPVFQFNLYGEDHTVEREMNYSKFYGARLGEVRTLYIDENDLTHFYDPREDKGSRIGLSIFLYILFAHLLAIGLLILFL